MARLLIDQMDRWDSSYLIDTGSAKGGAFERLRGCNIRRLHVRMNASRTSFLQEFSQTRSDQLTAQSTASHVPVEADAHFPVSIRPRVKPNLSERACRLVLGDEYQRSATGFL